MSRGTEHQEIDYKKIDYHNYMARYAALAKVFLSAPFTYCDG